MENTTKWVAVTWDNESPRLTSKRQWDNESEAKDDVRTWYYESSKDPNCEGATISDDGLFATATINGRWESCEAFPIE